MALAALLWSCTDTRKPKNWRLGEETSVAWRQLEDLKTGGRLGGETNPGTLLGKIDGTMYLARQRAGWDWYPDVVPFPSDRQSESLAGAIASVATQSDYANGLLEAGSRTFLSTRYSTYVLENGSEDWRELSVNIQEFVASDGGVFGVYTPLRDSEQSIAYRLSDGGKWEEIARGFEDFGACGDELIIDRGSEGGVEYGRNGDWNEMHHPPRNRSVLFGQGPIPSIDGEFWASSRDDDRLYKSTNCVDWSVDFPDDPASNLHSFTRVESGESASSYAIDSRASKAKGERRNDRIVEIDGGTAKVVIASRFETLLDMWVAGGELYAVGRGTGLLRVNLKAGRLVQTGPILNTPVHVEQIGTALAASANPNTALWMDPEGGNHLYVLESGRAEWTHHPFAGSDINLLGTYEGKFLVQRTDRETGRNRLVVVSPDGSRSTLEDNLPTSGTGREFAAAAALGDDLFILKDEMEILRLKSDGGFRESKLPNAFDKNGDLVRHNEYLWASYQRADGLGLVRREESGDWERVSDGVPKPRGQPTFIDAQFMSTERRLYLHLITRTSSGGKLVLHGRLFRWMEDGERWKKLGSGAKDEELGSGLLPTYAASSTSLYRVDRKEVERFERKSGKWTSLTGNLPEDLAHVLSVSKERICVGVQGRGLWVRER